MSTYYYLVCREHNEGVYITDNKVNPPERKYVTNFFLAHLYKDCVITFESEHDIDGVFIPGDEE